MDFEVLTPEKRIFSGDVEFVSGFSSEGSFGVLARHLPAFFQLKSGSLVVDGEDGRQKFAVYGGFLIKDGEERIRVLSREARKASELEESETRDRKRSLEERLSGEDLTDEERQKLERQLQRAEVDLAVIAGEQ